MRLCYGTEDRDAGLYALEGQPKTADRRRMQYFQHYHRSCSLNPKVRQGGWVGGGRIKEPFSRPRLQEHFPRATEQMQRIDVAFMDSNQSQGPSSAPLTCLKCGKTGHICRSAQVSEVRMITRNRQLLPLRMTISYIATLEPRRQRVVLSHRLETLIGLAATERLLVRRSPHVARSHLLRPQKDSWCIVP